MCCGPCSAAALPSLPHLPPLPLSISPPLSLSLQAFMGSDFYTNEALPALGEAAALMVEEPHRQSFVYADSIEDL